MTLDVSQELQCGGFIETRSACCRASAAAEGQCRASADWEQTNLRVGVGEGRWLPDHVPDDEERGHQHDDRGQQEAADEVGDERVVPHVRGARSHRGVSHHEGGGVHLDDGAVAQRLVGHLQEGRQLYEGRTKEESYTRARS